MFPEAACSHKKTQYRFFARRVRGKERRLLSRTAGDNRAYACVPKNKNRKGSCCQSNAIRGKFGNERERTRSKWWIAFSFPGQYCSTPLLHPFCAQSFFARHDGYKFCGYILGVLKRSSSFNNNLLYYLLISTCIIFLPACLNTKIYFPDCREPLAWSGKYFLSGWLFLLSTESTLLSSGERVSVSVEPWLLEGSGTMLPQEIDLEFYSLLSYSKKLVWIYTIH